MDEQAVNKQSLEELFVKLEAVVNELEGDDLPLEQAFKLYEEGVKLTALCEREIDVIDKKVLLLSDGGKTDEFS